MCHVLAEHSFWHYTLQKPFSSAKVSGDDSDDGFSISLGSRVSLTWSIAHGVDEKTIPLLFEAMEPWG